jgi:hypothetical protein
VRRRGRGRGGCRSSCTDRVCMRCCLQQPDGVSHAVWPALMALPMGVQPCADPCT